MSPVLTSALAVACLGCAASPRYTSVSHLSRGQLSGGLERVQQGMASFYADEYHGRPTASGEVYNMHDLTAAHPALPFNTRVRVVNLENGQSVVVRINDRGPSVQGRIIDLSYQAARAIGMVGPGTTRVRLEVLEMGDG